MTKFPYFSGNIKDSRCLGLVDLSYFIESHKKPTQYIQFVLDLVKQAAQSNDLKAKNKLKEKLFSFTPAVIFNKGDRRMLINVVEFTGLMQLDFDKIPTRQEAVDLKDQLFYDFPQIVCMYVSPSGKGVKGLLKITKCQDIDQYRRIYNSVEATFEMSYFDKAVKNAVLPLFLSEDKDILYRPIEETETWTEELEKEVHVQEFVPPEYSYTSNQEKYYLEKTVRIYTDKINSIMGDGHPQLLSATLILGTRVGFGYISMYEAEYLAEGLVRSNAYLQKGISGYLRTVKDGLRMGSETPKGYN